MTRDNRTISRPQLTRRKRTKADQKTSRTANPTLTRSAQGRGVNFLRTTLITWLGLLVVSAWAAIPAGALRDPRYGLGYLVVTYYPGVTNDGTGDCTAGIQAAIDDSFDANRNFQSKTHPNRGLAVFFPPGTYQISDILECYNWEGTNTGFLNGFQILVGSTEGAARPRIKLAAGAAKYQTTNPPRQMLSFRKFHGGDGTPVPVPDPMNAPSGYTDAVGNLFWCELRNIDFDCNGNPGAVGVTLAGCQWCAIENVKVNATGAFAGFCALPGAGSCCANLEVEGGQYGIMHGSYRPLGVWVTGSSGPVIAGLKLQNQTVQAMKLCDTISPITVVGFQISNSTSVAAIHYWNMLSGSLTLLDGQIGINSSTNLVAIDNTYGKDIYVRNVYVTGTTNLVRSGSTTTTGTGTWNQIAEYSYNNTTDVAGVPPNTGYSSTAINFESDSLINGTLQDRTVAFPVSPKVVTNSVAPPSDLVSRHLWASFPSYNGAAGDPATVVVTTNAGWNNTNDDTVVLQAAIDQAHTNNGRVFLPGGLYFITNTLTLYANTVLMGAGWQLSRIAVNPLWQPTSGEVPMVQTVDDAGATTTMAWLTLTTRVANSDFETNYSRFNSVGWRAGGNSLVIGAEMQEPYNYGVRGNTQPRAQVKYSGHGGGHWYTMSLHGAGNYALNHGYRKVAITGTTQPLWFYGFNIEHGMGDHEVDISGASNVRMLGWKRENAIANPLLVITNGTNIALYGAGALRDNPGSPGCFYLSGASTNLLLANLAVQQIYHTPQSWDTLVHEALTGLPTNKVLWPNHVSLYKRGEINDTLMFVTGGSAPATPTGLTATRDVTSPSSQINLFWNSVTNATGYQLQRSTTNNGPYAVLANTAAAVTNYSDTPVTPGTAYYYVVAASNSAGPSTNSAPATATTRTNAAPTLNPISDLAANMNAPLQTVNLSGLSAGANESSQTLTITASSSNTNLINPTVTYTSPSPTGTLTFTPVANASGTANLTVTVKDDGGTAGGGVDTVTRTLAVAITSHLAFAAPVVSGGRLVLTGNGGLTGGTYQVLTSTNIVLPLSSWTPVLTNTFGADGSFSNAIPMTPLDPQRFYRLQVNPTPTVPFDHAIVQAATAPVIDGTVDAIWNTANSAAITHVSSGTISNSADCSGTFRTLWDATNLYVLVQVTDDVGVHDSGTTGYNDDSVEVYLDANNKKATNYLATDYHYRVDLPGGSNLVVVELAHNSTNGVVVGRTAGVNGNYVVELKFPWSTLGQSSVVVGALLGLEVQIDDDDDGGARDGELQWHDTADKAYLNPSVFATARLAPSP